MNSTCKTQLEELGIGRDKLGYKGVHMQMVKEGDKTTLDTLTRPVLCPCLWIALVQSTSTMNSFLSQNQ
jgi:hypothetical protein